MKILGIIAIVGTILGTIGMFYGAIKAKTEEIEIGNAIVDLMLNRQDITTVQRRFNDDTYIDSNVN